MGTRLKLHSYEYKAVAGGIALAIFILAPPIYLKSWLLAGYALGTVGFAFMLIWAAAAALAAFLALLDRFSPTD
jgi:hypothetical protein